MADSTRRSFRLDKAKLAARLRLTAGEVEAWLIAKGFKPDGEHWHTDDGQITLIRPEEIIESRTRQTINGVTFVDTLPGDQTGK